MSKKPIFLDFSNLKIDAWEIVTIPIRLLGRAAIESSPEAQSYPPATDFVGKTSTDPTGFSHSS